MAEAKPPETAVEIVDVPLLLEPRRPKWVRRKW